MKQRHRYQWEPGAKPIQREKMFKHRSQTLEKAFLRRKKIKNMRAYKI